MHELYAGECDDTFNSIDHMGNHDGPQYWRYGNSWSGYGDNHYTMLPEGNPYLKGAHYNILGMSPLEEAFGMSFEEAVPDTKYNDGDFEGFFSEIYNLNKSLIDDEIIKHITNRKFTMLIRKDFPTLNVSCDIINNLILKHNLTYINPHY